MYSFLSMEAILRLKSSGAIPKKVRIFIRLVTHTNVYMYMYVPNSQVFLSK